MKKTKNYCEKNHLVFTAESNKLPNNIKFKFIKIEAGMDSEIKYKNIIHGERNGISFIICEFNISFSNTKGTGYTSNFPLLIIKKDNALQTKIVDLKDPLLILANFLIKNAVGGVLIIKSKLLSS